MAEAIIFDIAAELILKLGSSALNEIGLWWGLKDELDKLKTSVSTIQDVLLDAEDKSMVNLQVKNWLGLLSEAMYDADDLLDEFSTEALRQQITGESKMSKKVSLFFSSSNKFAFGLKMGHKVKALRDRLDEIAAQKTKFHLEIRSVERRVVSVDQVRDQTHSSPPQVIIGRQADKEAIVELLLASDYQENVSVVPIVGIGGLGKTTLAQMVCNDDMVQKHFELKMWVCVSDDFDVKLLVHKVLESASGVLPNVTEMDPLKNLLHEKINGRRYLLVLDDVWDEDVNKWFNLKDLLAGGARGSKIVITTRVKKVAEMSRPISIYELRGLPENEAWLLFKQMAFEQGQVLNPSFDEIGREIVAKCCGVPLAIKTIGGMMYSKRLESEWLLFKNEELSKIDVYKNDILPILKLSYNHLPSHYKHCFAYCSLYPKDYEIPVEQLILLWRAQGYLKSTNSNECLRDAGFRCFTDLLRLSFFQEAKQDDFGNVTICKMHDLMHDLALSIAWDNFPASHSRITSIGERIHHMSLWADQSTYLQHFSSLLKAKRIRTVLTMVTYETAYLKTEDVDVFCNLRRTRVLHLSRMCFDRLPSSIYKLKHLRHLDLSYNIYIKKLPDSITDLPNLQVLNLKGCTMIEQLPDDITKLVNLTDLDNDGCGRLTYMPRAIGKMTRLEKLSTFVIAKDNANSKHSGGLNTLHALNNLRGSLKITDLQYMKNAALEFKAANLNAKKRLHELTLAWNDYGDLKDNVIGDEEVGLEAVRPNQSLKGLSIYRCKVVRPPSWLPSLTNLVSLHFADCRSFQMLPPFDHLSCLKKLWIFGLTNLERIDVDVKFENGGVSLGSFFPSLTELLLEDCPNLKGFLRCKTDAGMKELPCFPCLSWLEIKSCPNLTYMPLFPGLKQLDLKEAGIKSVMEVMKTMSTDGKSFSTLSQLRDLSISEMEDGQLDELLQYLPSLQTLRFFGCLCRSLSSDKNDDGMLWQCLSVLRSIQLISLDNLVSLPKGFQYVTTLQSLSIIECGSLLSIPEWMCNLTALQDLIIASCFHLSESCKNNMAEDWPRISHIPNITIGIKIIQRNGCYML